MEEKQLNFNQPLLSVRRFSSTVASQKDEKRKTDNSLLSIPSLPSYKPELKSGPLRDPGSVPFTWEHSPGRPKDETTPHIHAIERPPTVPKLPPGRILKPKKQENLDIISEDTSVTKGSKKDRFGPQSVPLTDEKKETKIESSKETMEESSDSGDGDEAYMDALDTLSRSESFFYNCSVSGLSGLDLDVKTFSTDPKTRDFMMGRFLPAAKAMTSEAPQHAPWKQPVVVKEQPREVKKMVNRDKRPPLRYGPNFVQDYVHDDNTEEESDDDYDDHGNTSSKVCGLLPRFCLLNPLPGMSVRTRIPMSPVNRTRGNSSSGGSCSETEHEPARFAIYEHRSLSKFQSSERHEERSALKNESAQSTKQNNFQKLEGSTLYKRLQGNGEAKDAEVIGFTSQKKGPISFKELLADGSNDREIDSASPMVEKTLYVDIIHKTETPKSNSLSSDGKRQSKLRENIKIFANSKALGETPSVHFLVKDIENLRMVDDSAKSQSNAQIPIDMNMEIQQSIGKDDKICQNSHMAASTKLLDNVNLDYEAQKPSLEESPKSSQGSFSAFPVPPPLPKSPSDSWLWRTLPSVSSKNASLRSYLGTGVHPRNPTWKERNVPHSEED